MHVASRTSFNGAREGNPYPGDPGETVWNAGERMHVVTFNDLQIFLFIRKLTPKCSFNDYSARRHERIGCGRKLRPVELGTWLTTVASRAGRPRLDIA